MKSLATTNPDVFLGPRTEAYKTARKTYWTYCYVHPKYTHEKTEEMPKESYDVALIKVGIFC